MHAGMTTTPPPCPVAADFDHVRAWVFDLDHTLYPPHMRLFDQIEARMTAYGGDALGVTEAETRAINPRLIHCAMTGYGRHNDMAGAPAYDVNIQAISGLMALTGTPETGPLRTGAPIVDYATGMTAAMAVMAALLRRAQTGLGAFVDVSMLETAFALMSSTITDYQLTGKAPTPRGNAANSRSPSSGVLACADGHISLGVNEEAQFQALARALQQDHWLTDSRFATAGARETHGRALGAALAGAVAVRAGRAAAHWALLAQGMRALAAVARERRAP